MAFGEKQQRIDELHAELAEANQKVELMVGDLALARTVSAIAEGVEAELLAFRDTGQLEEVAEAETKVAVIAREKQRMVSELSVTLQDKKYDDYAAQFRANEGQNIKASLHELFGSDGTYEEIRKKAEDDIRAEIQDDLMAKEKANVDEDLATPDKKAAYIESVRADVAASAEIEQYRQALRNELQAGWHDEAIQTQHQQIDVEEQGREADYKKAVADQYVGSNEGKRYRESIRQRLQDEWHSKSIREVAGVIQDEELSALLTKRAAQEKERLARETRAAELLGHFEGSGLDVSELAEGCILTIYLGSVGSSNVKELRKDDWGNTHEVVVAKSAVLCERKLTLSAKGDGRFIVNDDSLLDSESHYARQHAIHRGTVIMVGRKIKENGKQELDHHVAADVPLYYDEDTSDTNITDALIPVANIKVDGVTARTFDVVRMV
ncbi:MAG: hypothetical protein JWS12_323 [Candidatus Saccharibacteria bacterium]|nr:hypothetical protein [Candidatus Saccharibacteria bacterium]